MKKRLLFLVVLALLSCLFTLAVSAEDEIPPVTDTYYLVQDADSELAVQLAAEGKNVVAYVDMLSGTGSSGINNPFFNTTNFDEGSHIEIIFAQNIFVPKSEATDNRGILINSRYVVTFRYNGFCHIIDSASDNNYNGIRVIHNDAMVRLIGTKAIDGENGTVSSIFTSPVIDSEANTYQMGGCNLDVYKTNGAYFQIDRGNIYVENLRGVAGNAVVYTDGNATGTYELKDCALDSVSSKALRLEGTSQKIIYVEKGYYDGISAYSALTPSCVKNATITGGSIHIDTWGLYNQVIRFEHCDINVDSITSSTGRTHYVFYQCNMRSDISWGLNGDNGGNQFVRIYSAPTCTEGGELTFSHSIPSRARLSRIIDGAFQQIKS